MDAKPNHPLRAIQPGGDENASLTGKSDIHKYKSTGNLTLTVFGAAEGLRAGAKRSVMNDLSNTSKAVGNAQDDIALVKGYEVKPVQLTAACDQENYPSLRSANPVKQIQIHVTKNLAAPCKRTNIFKDLSSESEQKPGAPQLEYDHNLPLGNGTSAEESVSGDQCKTVNNSEGVVLKGQPSLDFHDSYLRMVQGGLTSDETISCSDGTDQSADSILAAENEYIEYYSVSNTISGGIGITGNVFPFFTDEIREEIEEAREVVEASKTKEDIEEEFWDTSMVAEYGNEIFEYMRDLDLYYLPRSDYMDIQNEIQWSMRAVLMDWMVQVHARFGLLPETLFLTVNCIDRFLSQKVVSLGKLQLVGATALFIAAKYEEVNCPTIAEIVYMVDGGYNADEILKAERFMLSLLSFQFGAPGPLSFLRRVSKADEYDLPTRTLSKYFMELTIMDERFVGLPASFIAAAAHCLSRMILKKGGWTPHHVHYSGYTWIQLQPCLCLMLECCQNPAQHHGAIFEKYCDKRYKRVAVEVQIEMTKGVNVPGHKGTFRAIDTTAPPPSYISRKSRFRRS